MDNPKKRTLDEIIDCSRKQLKTTIDSFELDGAGVIRVSRTSGIFAFIFQLTIEGQQRLLVLAQPNILADCTRQLMNSLKMFEFEASAELLSQITEKIKKAMIEARKCDVVILSDWMFQRKMSR